MLIVMAGLPGAGKSTIAEIIAARMQLPVVSVDPIESAILSAGIDADQPTGLAAYLVAETLADAVLTTGRGAVVDAVNAVAPAREQWVRLADAHRTPLKFIEVTCSDAGLHRSRIEGRGRRHENLDEPSWPAVEQRLDEWEPWAGASATIARITLDTVEPLGANVDRAMVFVAS